MYGFCELRIAFRFFKVTRIRDITILAAEFIPTVNFQKKWPEVEQHQIELVFTKEMLGILYDYYTEDELLILKDQVVVTFLATDLSELAKFLLRFGKQVTVKEPRALVAEHQRLISDLFSIYKR